MVVNTTVAVDAASEMSAMTMSRLVTLQARTSIDAAVTRLTT